MATVTVADGGRIPGPALLRLLWLIVVHRGDRFAVIRRLIARYGDLVQFSAAGRTFVLCGHPEAVREVLIRQQRHFGKGAYYARVRELQGDGMVTAEGEEYRRQRQEVQHLFSHKRIDELAPILVQTSSELMASWRSGETVDLAETMKWVSLRNATAALFHVDVGPDTARILRSIDVLIDELHKVHRMVLPFAAAIDRLPLPSRFRLRSARRLLDETIDGWLERRRGASDRPDDILTAVVAGMEQRGGNAEVGRRQARDRVLTLLVAGIETTASALASTWYLLGRDAAVERKLHQELDSVLAGRMPVLGDLERLPFVGHVSHEALRLLPPIASISRSARCPVDLPGGRVPENASVGLSQWQIQRDERFFAEAGRFMPERWAERERAGSLDEAYFPFGLGGRRCIGERFALLEMQLTLATIAQRWRLRIPAEIALELNVSITVRARHRLPAVLEARLPSPVPA